MFNFKVLNISNGALLDGGDGVSYSVHFTGDVEGLEYIANSYVGHYISGIPADCCIAKDLISSDRH